MTNPIVHFEIAAKDAGKLQQFYTGLFDWNLQVFEQFSYGMVETKDGDLGINGAIFPGGPESGPVGVRVYAQVADADAALKKAEELGGKSLGPAVEVEGQGIKVAQFTDPEGNVCGVVQPL